ncbi:MULTISPECIES: hypothetical protein [Flavobacterium]|uniref:YD repeat-containing protein n=1 Tax=Flavobacterium jumunjinense TaxID=998845 RepID=A0ABV5GJY2_9FLAO|nr:MULTISPECIES: hypothetical protein [Flavobacterium]
MTKSILKTIAILFLLTIASCSKDDDSDPVETPEKKLKSITSSQGITTKTTTFNYDTSGKWISGVNRFGKNYSVNYTSNDKISSFDVENQSSGVEYLYSPAPDFSLNKIKVDTYETDLIYNNFRISDFEFYDPSLENTVNVTYDAVGRIATITNNDEQTRFSYTYDSSNRIIRVDQLGTGSPAEPYVLTSYAEYEYESHKNPVYKFFKQQMDFGQFIFSPIEIYPYFSRIFNYTDYNNIYILPEYNIKSVKEYSVNNTTQPIFDVTMSYTLENEKVMSFTTTIIYNGTTSSEQTSYTYEN